MKSSRHAPRSLPRLCITLGVLLSVIALGACSGATGSVDGNVVHTGRIGLTLGPDGWFASSEDGSVEGIFMVDDGDEPVYTLPTFVDVERLTPDGVAITGREAERVLYGTDGAELATIAPKDVINAVVEARDDPDSVSTLTSMEIVALSEDTLVFAACFGPNDVPALAGFSLADGSSVWAADLAEGCEDTIKEQSGTLGTQQYFVVRSEANAARAVHIDTGRTVGNWQDAPFGRLLITGDRIVDATRGQAVVTALEDSTEVVTAPECPGARIAPPGTNSDHLAVEATVSLGCDDGTTRLLDPETDEFVTVDAPPADTVGPIVLDDSSSTYDRLLLTRSGEEVTVVDALTEQELGVIDVPEDYRISPQAPRGHIVGLFRTDEDDMDTEFVFLDARSAAVIGTSSGRLSPGLEVAPSGQALVSASSQTVPGRGTEPDREREARSWVVSID